MKQTLPDRFEDFVRCYKNEKRKDIDYLTYTISDYLMRLRVTRSFGSDVDGTAAVPKLEQQVNILRSAEARLESRLYDMTEVVQADLFDDAI